MSRRKQSHPKPLKRKLEDDEVEELAEQLCLPRDLLSLGECSDSEGEFSVQTVRKLGRGLVFGPYKAKVKNDRGGEREEASQIKVRDSSGGKMVILLNDSRSHWLKLTGSTTEERNANLSIYTHGNEIWCRLEEDVQADTKLRSIFCGDRTFVGRGSPDVLTNGNGFPASPEKESGSEEDDRRTRINGQVLSRKVKIEPPSPESGPRSSKQEDAPLAEVFPGAFPYGFAPGAPSGSLIYVNYLSGQQTSPRPSSVSSVSSDQNESRIIKTGYRCIPCGITFSSSRTLEAHRSFYCAHRENPTPAPLAKSRFEEANDSKDGASGKNRLRNKRRSPESEASEGTKTEEAAIDDPGRGTSEPKSARRMYPCPFCEYVTDRKGGLNRHARMHDGTRADRGRSPGDRPPAESNIASSRYCADCDIQFSSQKTYQVHKGFYCNTRHVHKATPAPASSPTAGPSCRDESTGKTAEVPSEATVDPKTGLVFGHPFYAAISTSPLILVPCSYLPGSGIAPSGASIPPEGSTEGPVSPVPAFAVLPNAERAATPVVRPPTPKSEADVAPGECSPTDGPLDLSVRRKSVDPSKQGSTPRADSEVRIDEVAVKRAPSTRVAASPSLGTSVLVKQGTSKCKECNIVFYKHENYLVHKRLYCASRRNRDGRSSASSPENGAPPSSPPTLRKDSEARSPGGSSPGPSPKGEGDSSPPNSLPTVYQFYCVACGIKFTSPDNLKAHQTYYCPKRDLGTVPVASPPVGVRGNDRRCPKCKNNFPSEETLRCHPCGSRRKCPYCDVYCPTLGAAQRHLVTHTGVKAFRCTICGYKGHTLRGMRTHIRIHLESGSNAPEEQYIVCVGEDGSAVGNRSGSPDSDGKSRDSSRGTPGNLSEDSDIPVGGSADSQHSCPFCGYTSSYKGNVVRHVKLVHRDGERPPSAVAPASAGRGAAAPSPSKGSPEDSESSEDSTGGSDGQNALKTEEDARVGMAVTKKSGPKYCKACDISFKHLSNFVAHKKYYCTPRSSDATQQETA